MKEQELMTIDELSEFFNHLCFSNCSWEYVTSGLAFFIHSLEIRISEDSLDARNWLNDLSKRLFIDVSEQGRDAHLKFVKDSIKYFRDVDEIKQENESKDETPNILDLSNQAENLNINAECLEVAKQISAILQNKNTPKKFYEAIMSELTDIPLESEFYTSPEYIAQAICGEVAE